MGDGKTVCQDGWEIHQVYVLQIKNISSIYPNHNHDFLQLKKSLSILSIKNMDTEEQT